MEGPMVAGRGPSEKRVVGLGFVRPRTTVKFFLMAIGLWLLAPVFFACSTGSDGPERVTDDRGGHRHTDARPHGNTDPRADGHADYDADTNAVRAADCGRRRGRRR